MTDDELVELLAPVVWDAPWTTADALTIARLFVPVVREAAPLVVAGGTPLVDPEQATPPATPPALGGGPVLRVKARRARMAALTDGARQ